MSHAHPVRGCVVLGSSGCSKSKGQAAIARCRLPPPLLRKPANEDKALKGEQNRGQQSAHALEPR